MIIDFPCILSILSRILVSLCSLEWWEINLTTGVRQDRQGHDRYLFLWLSTNNEMINKEKVVFLFFINPKIKKKQQDSY